MLTVSGAVHKVAARTLPITGLRGETTAGNVHAVRHRVGAGSALSVISLRTIVEEHAGGAMRHTRHAGAVLQVRVRRTPPTTTLVEVGTCRRSGARVARVVTMVTAAARMIPCIARSALGALVDAPYFHQCKMSLVA